MPFVAPFTVLDLQEGDPSGDLALPQPCSSEFLEGVEEFADSVSERETSSLHGESNKPASSTVEVITYLHGHAAGPREGAGHAESIMTAGARDSVLIRLFWILVDAGFVAACLEGLQSFDLLVGRFEGFVDSSAGALPS